MNINEAVEIARQMKNHYRAFEKIEEVLAEVSKIGDMQIRVNKLRVEIEELEKTKAKTQATISANMSSDGIKYDEFKVDMTQKTEKLNQDYRAKAKEINDKIKAMEQRLIEKNQELSEADKVHKEILAEMSTEIGLAEKKLADTQKALETIKSKI